MTETPADDQPGFVAEEPEHCHDCYWLIRPGQGYFLTIEQAVVCPDCAKKGDAIRLAGGLTVEVQEDRLLVMRGGETVEVLTHDVRHLADALVEAAALLSSARWVRKARSSVAPISAGRPVSWK
jgi:hypothetical protein